MEFFKGTKESCDAYNDTVTASQNYKSGTTNWSKPWYDELQDVWVVAKHKDFPASEGLTNYTPQTPELP